MNLLICTQKVDRNDPILGFFHRWIEEFSKEFEKISVICLEKGEYDLPKNVQVFSLGKEEGKSKAKYIFNFYKYIWGERKNYDSIFVHMNQEYVLLGSFLWKAWGKKTVMWRNHHYGNFLTKIAMLLSDILMCTSKYSFTARTSKTKIMPVGIDTNLFQDKKNNRIKNSVLFISRISPIKKPDLLIDSIFVLSKNKKNLKVSVVGDPAKEDKNFYDSLKKKVNKLYIYNIFSFVDSVPNHKTINIYNQHEVFINLSTSGMYDKTIFEAMACGCLVLSTNKNLVEEIDEMFVLNSEKPDYIASKIEAIFSLSEEQKRKYRNILIEYTDRKHSLINLSNEIRDVLIDN